METVAAAIPGPLIAAGGIVIALVLAICLAALWSARRAGLRAAETAQAQAVDLQSAVGALRQTQSETTGRIQAMAELLSGKQAELNQALSERLDGMSHRLSQSVGDATKNTHENLKSLHERLAVLDAAQQNISELSGQVTTLANILANKQSRGAFGQGRMEAIVSDNLPPGSFAFQFTLKSGGRPDCIIRLPNDAPPLVVDAKFPLEAYNALKAAASPEELKAAQVQFRNDVARHIRDIAEKYLIPGETHDTAFMFVPSESVFAEIHERFDEVVQRAYRTRVVIVSPSLLLLSIQVIQQVLRDHRLREQAHVIQDEVRLMMVDVERLDERVRKLAGHFGMVEKDIEQVLISSEKIAKRGRGIESVGVGVEPAQPATKLLESDLFEAEK
ncbi:MAG TPA: DNA recombination protein RmuC [Propylenella sp.]